MSDQNETQEIAQLKQVNEELSESLERRQAMLKDYRSKIAANSNESAPDHREHGESRRG